MHSKKLFIIAITFSVFQFAYMAAGTQGDNVITEKNEIRLPISDNTPYDSSRGYGWFGMLRGPGWALKACALSDRNGNTVSQGIQNGHAPSVSGSAFRYNLPNGEYVAKFDVSGGIMFGGSWDIFIAGKRVSKGTTQPQENKFVQVNVYVTNGYFVFGMCRSTINSVTLTKISDKASYAMSSKELGDFSPDELITHKDWKIFFEKFSKKPSIDYVIDFNLLRTEQQRKEINEKKIKTNLPDEYWTDIPLTLGWESAGNNVTVQRQLTFKAKKLNVLDIRVLFFEKPLPGSKVTCRILGKEYTYVCQGDMFDWQPQFRITDATILKAIKEKHNFTINIASESGKIGKYVYQLTTPVSWIPSKDSQDGENSITAVTFYAEFKGEGNQYEKSHTAYDLPHVDKNRKAPPAEKKVIFLEKAEIFLKSPRNELCLNGLWQFHPVDKGGLNPSPKDIPTGDWGKILIPGTWEGVRGKKIKSISHDNIEWVLKPAGWHQKTFDIPSEWAGKRIELNIPQINFYAVFFLNGIYVGEHIGPYWPVKLDITKYIKFGKENVLSVYVENNKRDLKRPFYLQRYSIRSGILRDVILNATPKVYIDRVLITPSVRKNELKIKTLISNTSNCKINLNLRHIVIDQTIPVKESALQSVELGPGESKEITSVIHWENPILWDIDNPYLYSLKTVLTNTGDCNLIDEKYERFGFRELWIENSDFYLNGHKFNFQGNSVLPYMQTFVDENIRMNLIMARYANRNATRMHLGGHCSPAPKIADQLGMLIIPELDLLDRNNLPPVNDNTNQPADGWDKELLDAIEVQLYQNWNNPSVVLQPIPKTLGQ